MYKCLISVLFLLSTLPCSANTISINDADWPPYFFKGESYQPIGFAKEILSICIPKTGYEAKFNYFPIKRMRYFIEKGDLDVHIYSYKPSREEFLIYAKEPIFKSSYRPFVHRKTPFTIQQLRDFDGLRIGHLQGLKYSESYYNYLNTQSNNKNVRTVPSNVALLSLLLDQKVDVFVNTVDTVMWLATTLGERHQIKMLDYDIQTKDYFVTVSKKSAAISNKRQFLNIMDSCIAELKSSGRYLVIKKGYGLE